MSIAVQHKVVGPAPPERTVAAVRSERKILKILFVIGLLALSFLLGAAVMYFKWPSSGLLADWFWSAENWQRLFKNSTGPAKVSQVTFTPNVDRSGAFDGYTLVSVAPGDKAYLINMRGDIVHTWTASFNAIWEHDNHPQLDRGLKDNVVCLFDLHMYPNGDLLVVFHCAGGNTEGCGLARIDKDSNVRWKYDRSVHHDVDVDDDGKIFLTSQEQLKESIEGLESIPKGALIDFIEVLPADGPQRGKPLKRISVIEALRDTELFPVIKKNAQPHGGDSRARGDVLHTNHVQVLRPEMAKHFAIPGWKPGQVMVSMRNLNALALIDLDTGKAVWTATGPWRAQHDPEFLDNGHLLIFDNMGSEDSSRVWEFDPKDESTPWVYPGESGIKFHCHERGMSQRLPNGNTFVCDTVEHELFEVTPDCKRVWVCPTKMHTHFARRYAPDEIHFLSSDVKPRP
jgi:hypothetical protein